MTVRQQLVCHVGPNKSRATGNENLHPPRLEKKDGGVVTFIAGSYCGGITLTNVSLCLATFGCPPRVV
jgi:hypothetical protein